MSDVHLDIYSKGKKQMTFSREKKWQLKGYPLVNLHSEECLYPNNAKLITRILVTNH